MTGRRVVRCDRARKSAGGCFGWPDERRGPNKRRTNHIGWKGALSGLSARLPSRYGGYYRRGYGVAGAAVGLLGVGIAGASGYGYPGYGYGAVYGSSSYWVWYPGVG